MTEATAVQASALEGATASVSGTSAAARLMRAHLRALGAEVHDGSTENAAEAVVTLRNGDRHAVTVDWAGPVTVPGLHDEATVQAACGVMHVHGRRSGSPRGIGVDYCGTAAGVLAMTGLLAAILRGEPRVRTSVAEAALLTISQYLAAAGADEAEAVDLRPGGPPFVSADGVRFEVEALVPEVWAAFWTELGTDRAAIRGGWKPYQFRYATATAPIPEALHTATRAATFAEITEAAAVSGASVCMLQGPIEPISAPWRVEPTEGRTTRDGSELAVYEAGRRIQAPMAAHLLGLLGARVIRVEPPGGDPLRGMPPVCRDISARWLALNRGKGAIEIDLKDPADRQRLRDKLAAADVFLHNWAPGNAEKWQLAAPDLPDGIVYAYTSGWGGGDLPDVPLGTDFMVQARTGLAELVRPSDEDPAPSLMTLVDVLGGLIGAEAVLAGVLTRRLTGRGVAVESSLLGAASALLAGTRERPAPGFRVPVEGRVDGVDVVTDLAALLGDPRFAAVLGRDDRGCPALGSPWRFFAATPAVKHLSDLVPCEVRRGWAADGLYRDRDLYSLFHEHVLAGPDRTAIVDADGELSYAELDLMARSLAVGLAGMGVEQGDVVGIQLPNGRLACAFDLAIAALGAISLPYPVGRGDREAASLLSRSGAVAVVTTTFYSDYPCAQRTSALAGELPELRTVIAAGDGPLPAGCVPVTALLAADPARFEPASPDPDGPARILVTSGSEAAPKMVLYSHNALVGGRGRFIGELIGDTPELRNYVMVPLASSYGSNGTSVTLAVHGGTLVLLPKFEPTAALAMIERARPTHVLAVPTMLRMIVDSPELDQFDTSSLRVVALGGAALDATTAARVRETLGCTVVNVYGSADGVNCHTALDDPPSHAHTAGRPNPTVARLRIVDDSLRDVPPGEVGEIVSLGPMSPMCYVGAPELNERYRTLDGWARTGDLGRIDADGYLHVVGRRKDVIIRGGMNISPAEVEAQLATHPAVRDVVCVPVPDDVLGERLCACVVASPAPTLEDLTAHLAAQGLEPRKFPERLVVVDALPLGAAGKVDRRAVQDLVRP